MKSGKHFEINNDIENNEEQQIEKEERDLHEALLDEFTKNNDVVEFEDDEFYEEKENYVLYFLKMLKNKINEIYQKITFVPLRLTGEVDLSKQRDIAKKKRYIKKRNRVYRNRIVLALVIIGVIVIGHSFLSK